MDLLNSLLVLASVPLLAITDVVRSKDGYSCFEHHQSAGRALLRACPIEDAYELFENLPGL